MTFLPSAAGIDLSTDLRTRAAGLRTEDSDFMHVLIRESRVLHIDTAGNDHLHISFASVKPLDIDGVTYHERDLSAFADRSLDFTSSHPPALLTALEAFVVQRTGLDFGTSHGDASWSIETHCLQGLRNSSNIHAIMNFNGFVMHLRGLAKRGLCFNNPNDVVEHGLALLCTPQIRCATLVTNKRERRTRRQQPPTIRIGFHLYWSDGAARGQGRQHRGGVVRCSRGSAYFGATGQSSAPMLTTYACLLENCSNNVAEYEVLIHSMEHALRIGAVRCCLQITSLSVVG